MKILVPVKQGLDTAAKLRFTSDGAGLDLAGARFVTNPFDEIALEEAVRLKEAGIASEVIAVTVGRATGAETLRAAMACGADRAILIEHEAPLEPLGLAKLLAAIVAREAPGLVIAGKQSIDGDSNQVGQMLAGLLGWPQATFASSVSVDGDAVTVVREIDEGLQTLRMPLPAVVTADLRLNQPRYASLPNVMKAKKKPIEQLSAAELGVDTAPRQTVVSVSQPPARAKGVMVANVDDLLGRLRDGGLLN